MKIIYHEERQQQKPNSRRGNETEGFEVRVFAPDIDKCDADRELPCFIEIQCWDGWDNTSEYRKYVGHPNLPHWTVSYNAENQAIREAIEMIDTEAERRWGKKEKGNSDE